MASIVSIFRRLGVLAGCYLAVLTVSRWVLVAVYSDRVAATDGLGLILLQGLRFDIILLGLVFGPVALFLPLLHTNKVSRRLRQWLLPPYLAAFTAAAFFVEMSTISFITEFDARPNFLFVEYLMYPKEVLPTLLGERPVSFIGFSLLSLLVLVAAFEWLRRDPNKDLRVSIPAFVVATPVIAVIAVAMVRSTLDHRPVNASVAAFSQDSLVNQLPLNSPYTLYYALYERQRDADRDRVRYGDMADEEILDIVLAEAGIQDTAPLDTTAPTLRHQPATRERDKPLNLVIVLEESLGSQYVGSLGGLDLTPEFDRLRDDGIFFDRLYATGTRSVRGIEAVLTCMTPRAQLAVVKLSETQQNFFTLASLLKRHGYQTSFVYGGESHFDNMKQFFLGNGFETIVDENDYENPVFQGAWGVSDEDLFNRAHEMFENAGDDKPFFSLVFTSSNHAPFDIPAGRVEESGYGPRETSIKYADYALGRFIHKARQSDYWDNTVFLVVADHGAHLTGGLVPLERFRIPGVILGGTIEPRRVTGITSQIDLLPTLLSLVGLSADHPCIGRDLTLPEYANGSGRASMQHGELQAYIEDDRMVILQHDLPPMTFTVDLTGIDAERIPDGDPALERKALAYALWGPLAIRNKAYFNHSKNQRLGALTPEASPAQSSQDDEAHELR